jgi:hypothetical protein
MSAERNPKMQYFCKDCDFIGSLHSLFEIQTKKCKKCKGELVELCHLQV